MYFEHLFIHHIESGAPLANCCTTVCEIVLLLNWTIDVNGGAVDISMRSIVYRDVILADIPKNGDVVLCTTSHAAGYLWVWLQDLFKKFTHILEE